MLSRIASVTVIFLAAGSFSATFFIKLCDVIFQCGCTHWWAGAADHCNIHIAGVKHCPWCVIPMWALGLNAAAILIPQLLFSAFPAQWAWWKRLIAALVCFPVFGGLAGLGTGLITGYWV